MSSLFPTAFGITLASGLLGSLVIPAAKKLCFGSVQENWLNREINFDTIDHKNTVVNKDLLYTRIYQLRGETYDTKPRELQNLLKKGRANFINDLSLLGITARFYGVKRQKDISHEAKWQTRTLQEIGNAETKVFKSAYEIRWFIVLSCKTLRPLEEIDEKIYSLYKIYQPKLLTSPDNPQKPCPVTGFLNYLCCGDLRDDLLPVSKNISGNIQASDLIFNKYQGNMIAHVPLPYITKIVNICAYPESITGELIHKIMCVSGELEVFQILKPLNKTKASVSFTRKARETRNNPWGNAAMGEECDTAVALISEGDTSFFDTQFSISVRAKTEPELDNLIETIRSILAKDGIKYNVETKTMGKSWFNRLPITKHDYLVRPLTLRNDDLAALWCWQFNPIGLAKSYWHDAPVRSFRTASGQAYSFQFQTTEANKALGNFCVFAPSGVGKSTLIMHLFGGLAKIPNFKTFVLDSKEGARFMIEALGGVYQSYDKLALNPLDAPSDDLATKQNISKMIKTMLGDIPKDEDIDELINHVVSTAFKLPLGARTFDSIFDLCFSRRTEIKRQFAKWVTNSKGTSGFYSHIFNSPRDTLSDFLGQSFMVGINMNEALEDETLGAPVVTHISTAIERIAKYGDLRGFAIFIDEAANLLRNETFREHATWLYREYRKMGGAVGMAFQDPSALFKSGVSDAVIENTSCFFFFPNPQGNREAYKAFNLNEEQEAFIWGGGLEGRKVLLVKRDAATGFEESVILDVDLSCLGNSLRFYQSGHDAVRKLTALKKQYGEDQWLNNLK